MKAKILLLAAGLALGELVPARAHAFLDHAQPRVGSTVKTAPRELKIWFSDDVELAASSVTVLDAGGKPVGVGKLSRDPKNGSLLILALPSLPAGAYKVVWQVTCDFGHVTKGDFTFVVAP